MNRYLKKIIIKSFIGKLILYFRYLIFRYIIKRRFKNYYLSNSVNINAVDNDGVTFFGYYNISPQNEQGDIIYLKVLHEYMRGSLHEPASIMLKTKEGLISKITETKAWNWQQGCMLQWYPRGGNYILYNDFNDIKNNYVTKIIDKNGRIIYEYNKPVNNVSRDGQFALTLNYDRLALMRPDYGYFNKKIAWKNLPTNEEDGIWFIDLIRNESRLILSLKTLTELRPVKSMQGAQHKVNHIDINPSGTRFMFLHRWKGPQGRFMRLITVNPDGSDIFILNGDIMISHSCWLNDNEILSYCELNGERGYFKFFDKKNGGVLFSDKMPQIDGHPSVSTDGNFIITDTYPDKSQFSSLYLFNKKNDTPYLLGKFFQPFKYRYEGRIDLHPKWGYNISNIFIESGHSNERKLYKITLK
jgi:hypothetical protein